MKIVILDKSTLGEDVDLSPVKACGEVVIYENTVSSEVEERISDADVVIINKIKLNETNLKNAKNLKLICVAATGYDNIDTDFCKEKGIALYNVPGYSTVSVAQVTVAMALSLVTRLTQYNRFVNDTSYSKSGVANSLSPVYHEISALKWGVVGAGGIGMKVADIAAVFGCQVSVCRRKAEGKYPVKDIDTILQESDIISVHLPLTDSTRGIISKERIAKMKETAIIINTARGAVTDEKALADAVLNKKIGGLGVDVYSVEPFKEDHPFYKLLNLDNVLMTPHMAWGSIESRNRCVQIMAQNIKNFYEKCDQNRIA